MLLLKSTVKLNMSADFFLRYDNGKDKRVVVNTDDYVLIKYHRNGSVTTTVAKVVSVDSVVTAAIAGSHRISGTDKNTSVKLILDRGLDFVSSRVSIRAESVINVRVISKELAIELAHRWDEINIVDEIFDDGIDIFDPFGENAKEEPDKTPDTDDTDSEVDDTTGSDDNSEKEPDDSESSENVTGGSADDETTA